MLGATGRPGLQLESTEAFSSALSHTPGGNQVSVEEKEAKPGQWEGKELDEDKVAAEPTDIWLGHVEELDGERGLGAQGKGQGKGEAAGRGEDAEPRSQ